MGKGLPRSTGRGTPGSQEIVKLTISVSTTITLAGATGVGFGTAVLSGLPEGNLLILGAVANMTFTGPASGITTTWNGDFSIGSAPTADATLNGAEVDIVPSTAVGPAVALVSPVTRGVNATQVMLDNTAADLELNLQLIVDDADISADDVIVTVVGQVYLALIVLGDD